MITALVISNAIPLSTDPNINNSVSNSVHLSADNITGGSISASTPQAAGQNISSAQATTFMATTGTSSRRCFSLPSLPKMLGLFTTIGFGAASMWYMYRADRNQVCTTKKDEREYCEGLKVRSLNCRRPKTPADIDRTYQ